MVSWIEAIASLRYCLAIVFNLRELSVLDERAELLVRQLKDVLRRLLECGDFLVADVGLLALGEPVDEEGSMTLNDTRSRSGSLLSGLARDEQRAV
jgi:hypothetical protein